MYAQSKTALCFHGIGGRVHLVFEARLRMRGIFERLLDAAPVLVEEPAVVVAAQPALLDEPVREVGAAVRAVAPDEPERPIQILVEHEIFAEQTDRLDRDRIELARAADRLPVAAEQVAHRRPGSDLREQPVLIFGQHVSGRPPVRRSPGGRRTCRR